ncbi:hypothetical protein PBT90_09990 [Algoriphagus halophytocola]|uniref:DUF3253 domain-containing protein n=1 Tax=Algoriphagus halophytocola TaxID=2991499 RepID=A0ABY6MJ99_9BACT|nr:MULTISPECIES: hypothetical protein [unclassified Algoriphagus]UZD23718.1 hypothetical protein OM944_04320 [Algoriphagus sp. TR-M5]WBL45012.1 hypothetical protein PBT90_09990 [Algoriphagus sp. TR-M9]
MEVLRTAILQTIRASGNRDFPAVKPLQNMFPEDWEQFLDELELELLQMEKEGLLEILKLPRDVAPNGHAIMDKKICSKSKL